MKERSMTRTSTSTGKIAGRTCVAVSGAEFATTTLPAIAVHVGVAARIELRDVGFDGPASSKPDAAARDAVSLACASGL